MKLTFKISGVLILVICVFFLGHKNGFVYFYASHKILPEFLAERYTRYVLSESTDWQLKRNVLVLYSSRAKTWSPIIAGEALSDVDWQVREIAVIEASRGKFEWSNNPLLVSFLKKLYQKEDEAALTKKLVGEMLAALK
jgi:hypothetical protein